ncbi:MAG: VCBS repeat-containing protein [Chloroflexota bacterium]|nr:VCBS repeat-containing protein [Chloroflexota bacterium]
MSGIQFAMEDPPSPEEVQAALRQFNTPVRQRASLKQGRTYAPLATADAVTRERCPRPQQKDRHPVSTTTEALPQDRQRSHRRRHVLPSLSGRTLLYLGVGMLVMLALCLVVVPWTLSVFTSLSDHWTYGTDRISHLSVNVGHSGPSEFLAEDLHGQILVIEFPAADPSKVHVYQVAMLPDESTPSAVTLTVQDVNHDGKPDLIVQVSGSDRAPVVLFNNGHTFQGADPAITPAHSMIPTKGGTSR